MMKKLGFLVLSVLISSNSEACDCQCGSKAPKPVGTIEDQMIFVGSTGCGPGSLQFDLTPYFNSYGEPLSYCLSNVAIDGDVSNLNVTVNPFTGMLNVPIGWFGVNTTIHLTIIGKNPEGSATQHMNIMLEPCGG
jgi:hypothetical protein